MWRRISTDTSTKQPVLKPWTSEYLIPSGSVLIAALALLAQYAQLPKWVIIIAVSYLVIATGVLLYIPVVRLFSSVVGKWRLRRLAKIYFPQLLESVKKLHQLVAAQNANTLLYVLEQTVQWDELRDKSLLPDPEHVATIRNWLSSIELCVERYKRDDFSCLCWELSSLIDQYNRFCCQRLKRLGELIAAGQLPEHRLRYLKQQWNVAREEHAAFIREWGTLAKRINERRGGQLCIESYESLGTLE
jgi:hypothetical protein